jgi:hypothetical protein
VAEAIFAPRRAWSKLNTDWVAEFIEEYIYWVPLRRLHISIISDMTLNGKCIGTAIHM